MMQDGLVFPLVVVGWASLLLAPMLLSAGSQARSDALGAQDTSFCPPHPAHAITRNALPPSVSQIFVASVAPHLPHCPTSTNPLHLPSPLSLLIRLMHACMPLLSLLLQNLTRATNTLRGRWARPRRSPPPVASKTRVATRIAAAPSPPSLLATLLARSTPHSSALPDIAGAAVAIAWGQAPPCALEGRNLHTRQD